MLLFTECIHETQFPVWGSLMWSRFLLFPLLLTLTHCRLFKTRSHTECRRIAGVLCSSAQGVELHKLQHICWRGCITVWDTSPLQPLLTHTQTHTNHNFVAGGLTFCEAAYLSSTCCVVFFVRSSESLTCGECPTEPINGSENLPRMLFTRWHSLPADESAFHPDAAVDALPFSPLAVCLWWWWRLRVHMRPYPPCAISSRLRIVTIVLLSVPACVSSLPLAVKCISLTRSPSNSWPSNINFHLKIILSLDSGTRESFLMRRGGLRDWMSECEPTCRTCLLRSKCEKKKQLILSCEITKFADVLLWLKVSSQINSVWLQNKNKRLWLKPARLTRQHDK